MKLWPVHFLRVCFASWCIYAFGLQSVSAQPLVINVDAGNPPFMYVAAGAKAPSGVYPAVVTEISKRLGTSVALGGLPWSRVLQEIDRGRAGAAGLYKNEERAAKYDYSDPIFVERIAVFFSTKNPIEFKSIRDLYGKRIGLVRGWSYGDAFDLARKNNHLLVEETGADRNNFMKLSLGRVDAVLAVVESGERLLEEGAGDFAYLKMAPTLLIRNPAYLAFSKKAGQQETLRLFNLELEKMAKDGSLEKLVRQELSR